MRKLLILLAFLAPVAARAETVPYVLGHHGRLLMSNDEPVSGDKEVTFELHTTDNPQLRQPKWSETLSVKVQQGSYAVLLGNVRQGGKPLDLALLTEPELYLSLTIDGTEMQPRLRVPSVPYALRAARAAEAEKVLANGVDTAALKDGAVTLAKLALTNGKFAGLDADTLDGLDSAAFAPAAIVETVNAINTSVGADLAGRVATLAGAVGTIENGSLAGEIGAVKGDVAGVKTDVGGVKADVAGVKTDVGGVKTDVAGVKSDVAAVKADTASAKADAAEAKAKATSADAKLGTWPQNADLAKLLIARGRYSETCNPATDAFLKDAYPGLSDADVRAACLADGRWHRWGDLMDYVKGNEPPTGFEFAVTNYSDRLQPAFVNSWNHGLRFCYGPTAVGDSATQDGNALVIQCASVVNSGANKLFTVTHKTVDSTASYYMQRTYNTSGVEQGTCTSTGAHTSCSNSESSPGFWKLWIRK